MKVDVKLLAHFSSQASALQSNAAHAVVAAGTETIRGTMWITLILLTLCFFTSQAKTISCDLVIEDCRNTDLAIWTRCYEDQIVNCRLPRGPPRPDFKHGRVNSSQKAELDIMNKYTVRVPSSALQKSRANTAEQEVLLVATLINSTLFKQTPRPSKGRAVFPQQLDRPQGEVLEENVLFVKAGLRPVKNLSEPIELRFRHNTTAINGICVFWEEPVAPNETGSWSRDGCETSKEGKEIICHCSHLSFFAVLVNPNIEVDEDNEEKLSYITYVGSALSALFAFISFFIYVGQHRQRPEKAISLHMQLTVALFCLHFGFLVCSFWVLNLKENDWVCSGLGLFLHWSLLATFTWVALEGFHLYLLLVRVFNIYVRRYLLKLSILGWGLPTLVAMICGILGVYGKYSLQVRNSNNRNSTSEICWLKRTDLVSYMTMGFLCLVVLYNSCMLLVVVFKMWGIRSGKGGYECSSDWKDMKKEKGVRLWKDCATVLGLSYVLGLPWGFAVLTYASLPGIYVFTILNSLQGLFVFLWSVALSCKSRSEKNISVRDPSTQKMTTTSF
ncbi:adhesion G-protein coupled receptor G1-like isoform X2 [Kryptolebias marmoratus]|uniref:adhesion G-protein coupled receptor G1-like isoform X2 n=1 Tax=Kryptolebias marmoratus TaxID=37003 RepID=UPI0018ACEFF7|nr:adhesion G-protein coupled receptor G1-like isoform X2 [Kryptolebias marmoratus]